MNLNILVDINCVQQIKQLSKTSDSLLKAKTNRIGGDDRG